LDSDIISEGKGCGATYSKHIIADICNIMRNRPLGTVADDGDIYVGSGEVLRGGNRLISAKCYRVGSGLGTYCIQRGFEIGKSSVGTYALGCYYNGSGSKI
jgi:hypothetical protein